MTFILFVKADSVDSVMDHLKVILTEQVSEYEETFMFDTKTILTKEEYSNLTQAMHENDRKKV